MNTEKVLSIIKRDAVAIYSADGFDKKLSSGKKLRIKLGADPSRPDLHLGHSVVLRKLRILQDLGHEIVFVIGDFTAMIGDPSGKSKARIPLTFEETRKNAESYLLQVTKILDKKSTSIVYNSEWLSKMNFSDVLTLAGKYTLARILERDDFSKRFNEKAPIGLHEIFYPLMQGYDSVELRADIEVGGTDQTFNLLVGRELQRDYGQEPQEVITFPLLAGLDGVEKMSKSLDNYIGINEEPGIMFEKCMKVPDNLLLQYFQLTTDIDESEYIDLIEKNIRDAHFLYAKTIVTMYYDDEAAKMALDRYSSVASGGVPLEIESFEFDVGLLLTDALVQGNLSPSKSESRRLITGNGIKLDGAVISDVAFAFNEAGEFVLSKGKNKFIKIIIRK